MELIAVMEVYNLTASVAKNMLEVLTEEKKAECVREYWRRAERRFNDR